MKKQGEIAGGGHEGEEKDHVSDSKRPATETEICNATLSKLIPRGRKTATISLSLHPLYNSPACQACDGFNSAPRQCRCLKPASISNTGTSITKKGLRGVTVLILVKSQERFITVLKTSTAISNCTCLGRICTSWRLILSELRVMWTGKGQ